MASDLLVVMAAMDKPIDRLEIGDEAPAFRLPATGEVAGRGQSATEITLARYRGERNVVLVFLPAAWTPV